MKFSLRMAPFNAFHAQVIFLYPKSCGFVMFSGGIERPVAWNGLLKFPNQSVFGICKQWTMQTCYWCFSVALHFFLHLANFRNYSIVFADILNMLIVFTGQLFPVQFTVSIFTTWKLNYAVIFLLHLTPNHIILCLAVRIKVFDILGDIWI